MTDEYLITDVPIVKLNGSEIPVDDKDRLVSVRSTSSLGAAAFAEVRLDDTEGHTAAFEVGAPLAIEALQGDTTTSLFEGEITSIAVDFEDARSELVVGAHDKAFRLGQQLDLGTVLNSKQSDVLTTLARELGLGADIDASSSTYEHFQKYGTLRELVDGIAEANGLEWFVRAGKLVVRKRASGTEPTVELDGGENLVSFHARVAASSAAEEVEIRRWDPTKKQVTVGTSTPSSSQLRSNAPAAGSAFDGAKAMAPGKVVALNPLVADETDANILATAIADQMTSTMVNARGTTAFVEPGVLPGEKVTVTGVAPDWNGDYRVRSVEHRWGSEGRFYTVFQCGAAGPPALAEPRGRAADGSWERLANGVTVGIVTDVADPDEMHRVKVKLPIIDDQNESFWARVVQMGAGSGRGWSLIPEVNDEVLVAFEHSDLQRPYVIGGLFNGRDKVAVRTGITNNQVMQRSFTSRTGHTLVFHDDSSPDGKYVEVKLSDGSTQLFVGEEKIDIVTAKTPITVKTAQSEINLDGKGAVKVKGNNVTIEAMQNLTLKANQEVKIEGLTVTANAKTKLTAKASAMAELDGGGMTNIKGGMVNLN